MTTYLLDTNILSHLIRNPHGKVAARIAEVGERNVATSIIVAAELRFGARKKGSARLNAQVEMVLEVLPILALDRPTDEQYGHIRSALEGSGTPIGANDMLIAAHAMALGHALVSDNVREFGRIEGLTVENWLTE